MLRRSSPNRATNHSGACEVEVVGEEIGGEEEREADGEETRDPSGRLRGEIKMR